MNCYDDSGCMCSQMMTPACAASDCVLSVSEREKQFPVGMGYVPFQSWQRTYPLEQGFRRGTMFPELDLSFMRGRCR